MRRIRATRRAKCGHLIVLSVVLLVVVFSMPSVRRLVGLPTIVTTSIEDSSTENPEAWREVSPPERENPLGFSWEWADQYGCPGTSASVVGEWHTVHAGLFKTKVVREEFHSTWIPLGPATAQMGPPEEAFTSRIVPAPGDNGKTTVKLRGYHPYGWGSPDQLKDHEFIGSAYCSLAIPGSVRCVPEVELAASVFTIQPEGGYEYLCVPVVEERALWQRGRYKIRRSKDGPPEPDLVKKRTLYQNYATVVFRRRCRVDTAPLAGNAPHESESRLPAEQGNGDRIEN
ncbi:MAG: hypothetical protein JW889_09000 [Verrucomicrobia bacterium]|nr:hypothetical protein [Verrucomicrobiota bacterium]